MQKTLTPVYAVIKVRGVPPWWQRQHKALQAQERWRRITRYKTFIWGKQINFSNHFLTWRCCKSREGPRRKCSPVTAPEISGRLQDVHLALNMVLDNADNFQEDILWLTLTVDQRHSEYTSLSMYPCITAGLLHKWGIKHTFTVKGMKNTRG